MNLANVRLFVAPIDSPVPLLPARTRSTNDEVAARLANWIRSLLRVGADELIDIAEWVGAYGASRPHAVLISVGPEPDAVRFVVARPSEDITLADLREGAGAIHLLTFVTDGTNQLAT